MLLTVPVFGLADNVSKETRKQLREKVLKEKKERKKGKAKKQNEGKDKGRELVTQAFGYPCETRILLY